MRSRKEWEGWLLLPEPLGWCIWCFDWHSCCFDWRTWCFGWRIKNALKTQGELDGPQQMWSWMLLPLLEASVATLWQPNFAVKSTSSGRREGFVLISVAVSVAHAAAAWRLPATIGIGHWQPCDVAQLWPAAAAAAGGGGGGGIVRRRRQNGAGSSSRGAQPEVATGRLQSITVELSPSECSSDQAAAALCDPRPNHPWHRRHRLQTNNTTHRYHISCWPVELKSRKILRSICQNSRNPIWSPKPSWGNYNKEIYISSWTTFHCQSVQWRKVGLTLTSIMQRNENLMDLMDLLF